MAPCYVREKKAVFCFTGLYSYGRKVVYFSMEILSMDFIIMFRV
jgi:hypothetical protein